jgi:3-hydroxyacyl-CoA dehydrogenase
MEANTEINRVAIVGTGLIGSSWAACFLAHGLDVVATDPAPGTEDKVRQNVESVWAALTKIGLWKDDRRSNRPLVRTAAGLRIAALSRP